LLCDSIINNSFTPINETDHCHVFNFTFDRTTLKVVMQDGITLIVDRELKNTIKFWSEQLQMLEK
jgi:hypothetical protein